MDQETNRAIADRIAADLRDIDANHPNYPASQRAFLADCERGFRNLAEEKGGYPVDGVGTADVIVTDPMQGERVADFSPENAVVAMRSDEEFVEGIFNRTVGPVLEAFDPAWLCERCRHE